MEATEGTAISASSSSLSASENDHLLDKPVSLYDNSKGHLSEDEGYVSGSEEFEAAVDKLLMDGNVEEGIEEGNYDAPFVDAPDKVESLPISDLGADYDDVKNSGDESGNASVDASVTDEIMEDKAGGGQITDVKNEVSDSVLSSNCYKIVDSGTGQAVVEAPDKVEYLPSSDLAEYSDGANEMENKDVGGASDFSINVAVDVSATDEIQEGKAGADEIVQEKNEVSDTVLISYEVSEDPSCTDEIQENKVGEDVIVDGKNEVSNSVSESSITDMITRSIEDASEGKVTQPDITQPDLVKSPKEKQIAESEPESEKVEENKGDLLEPVSNLANEEDDGETKLSEPEKARGVPVENVENEISAKVSTIQDAIIEDVVSERKDKDVSEQKAIEPETTQPEAVNSPEFGEGTGQVTISPEEIHNAESEKVGENEGEKIQGGSDSLEPVANVVGEEDDVEMKLSQLDKEEEAPVENSRHAISDAEHSKIVDDESEESKSIASTEPMSAIHSREVADFDNHVDEEILLENSDTDSALLEITEAAKEMMEEWDREDSQIVADTSLNQQTDEIDGQIVTDSEEGGDTDEDDDGEGKELFDSSTLAALLKAATGTDSDGGTITITSQDGSKLFSVERPAGLGSPLRSLRPTARLNRPSIFGTSAAPSTGVESETNLSQEEKTKLEKLQQIRVKFLRLLHRLGLSPEEPTAAQVLYRLALLGGKQTTHIFNLDAAKKIALEMETTGNDALEFSVNILILGKCGVGKSSTVNSLFGEEKSPVSTFVMGTSRAKEISGLVDGVKLRVIDTPGLKPSALEQRFNRGVLSSVKKFSSKAPPDVVLYVDRLDSQTRDLNDLPLLKSITSVLGSSIWRNAIVTLTHAGSAPPDGLSGAPLSYEIFISQRSHVVQQSIGHSVGDLRMMSPSLMNPVSLVENHASCRKNQDGHRILPNGQSWRPQLLLLCYSMKILSEASSLSRPQDPFDHRKLFGFRARSPPLPYMLSTMLQSRPHPKLQSDQGGDGIDSDIDIDDEILDSDQEEGDEYDELPPFKPLTKNQLANISKQQRKAYFEEYDYRIKLLHKKHWKEELKRMKEMKRKGKDSTTEYGGYLEDEADSGAAAAPVSVPLPDMALPPTFDAANPAYRYRFLEPTSTFLARPVLDTHGWDHDCGYDGVNLEHSLAIASRFPVSYTVQVTKDKKDFTISLDSSIAAKYGDKISTMANFDIQSMGKQLAYILRAESKLKNLKKHKAAGGISITFLGENVVPGLRIEDQISIGKQYGLVGSAGVVKSQHDTAYGANVEIQRREVDYPIGQVQSTFSLSVIKWRGDLALGFNSLAQFGIGRNSKIAVRAGINNKLSGQISVRTSSSEHLSLALAAVIPTVLSIYKKLKPSEGEKYSIF